MFVIPYDRFCYAVLVKDHDTTASGIDLSVAVIEWAAGCRGGSGDAAGTNTTERPEPVVEVVYTQEWEKKRTRFHICL